MSNAAAAPAVDELEGYRRQLVAYCYRMLASPFEAEDAVQETIRAAASATIAGWSSASTPSRS